MSCELWPIALSFFLGGMTGVFLLTMVMMAGRERDHE